MKKYYILLLLPLLFGFTGPNGSLKKPYYRSVYNWNELNQYNQYIIDYIDNFGVYTVNFTSTPDSSYVANIDHLLIKSRGTITHTQLDNFYAEKGNYLTTEVDPFWTAIKENYLTVEVDPKISTTFVNASTNGIVDSTHFTAWQRVSSHTSGVYTPTLTSVSNIDSTSTYQAQYIRVDSCVTVSGRAYIDQTTAGASSEIGLSLPISSSIAIRSNCCGTIYSGAVDQGGAIYGDAANDRAEIIFLCTDTTRSEYFYTFTYLIQ